MSSFRELITKNKSVSLGLGVVIIVILLAISSGLNGRDAVPLASPLPSTTRLEIIDLNEEKRRQAVDYRASVIQHFPIYVENFKTSVGIDTTINLYALADDPLEVVRLEIYGLSYLNAESDPKKNPNVEAFKESYLHAIKLLKEKGVDPKRLIFIYGDKEYVRETTLIWLAALRLSP